MQWKVVTFFARDIQAGGGNKMMFSLLIILCFCPDCAVIAKIAMFNLIFFKEFFFISAAYVSASLLR